MARIQFRRDSAANWDLHNPILADGEIGIEKDTARFKLGNGIADWVTLSYSTSAGIGGTDIPDVTVQATGNEGTEIDVLINNYDSSILYDYAVSGGSLNINSNPFKWLLPDVTASTQHSITIFATNVGQTTSAVKHLVNVLPVSMASDELYSEFPLKGYTYRKQLLQDTDESNYSTLTTVLDTVNLNAEVDGASSNNLLKLKRNVTGKTVIAKTAGGAFFDVDTTNLVRSDNTVASVGFITEEQKQANETARYFKMDNGNILRIDAPRTLTMFNENMEFLSTSIMNLPKTATSVTSFLPNTNDGTTQVVGNYLFVCTPITTTYQTVVVDLTSYTYVGDMIASTDSTATNYWNIVFDGTMVCATAPNSSTATTAYAYIWSPFSANLTLNTTVTKGSSDAAGIVPLGNGVFCVLFTTTASGAVEARIVGTGFSGSGLTLSSAQTGLVSTIAHNNFTIYTKKGEAYFLNNNSQLVKFIVTAPDKYYPWSNTDFPAGSIQIETYTLGDDFNGIYHDPRTNYTYLLQQGNILKAFRDDFSLLTSATVPITFTNYATTVITTHNPILLNNKGHIMYFTRNADNTLWYKVTTDALGVCNVTYDVNMTEYALAEAVSEAYIKPAIDFTLDIYMNSRGKLENDTTLATTVTSTAATLLPTKKINKDRLKAVDVSGTKEALTNVVINETTVIPTYSLVATLPTGTLATPTAATSTNIQNWLLPTGEYLVTGKYTTSTLYFEKWSSDFTTITNYTISTGSSLNSPKTTRVNANIFATVTSVVNKYPRVSIFNSDTGAIIITSVTATADNANYDFDGAATDITSDGTYIYVIAYSTTVSYQRSFLWVLDLDGNRVMEIDYGATLTDKWGVGIGTGFNLWINAVQSAFVFNNVIYLHDLGNPNTPKGTYLTIDLETYFLEEVPFNISPYREITHTRNPDGSKYWIYKHPTTYLTYFAFQDAGGEIKYRTQIGTNANIFTLTTHVIIRLSDDMFIVKADSTLSYIIKDTGTSFEVLYSLGSVAGTLSQVNVQNGAFHGNYIIDNFKNKLILNINNATSPREIDLVPLFSSKYDITYDATTITPTSIEAFEVDTLRPTVASVVNYNNESQFTYTGVSTSFRAASLGMKPINEVNRINIQLNREA